MVLFYSKMQQWHGSEAFDWWRPTCICFVSKHGEPRRHVFYGRTRKKKRKSFCRRNVRKSGIRTRTNPVFSTASKIKVVIYWTTYTLGGYNKTIDYAVQGIFCIIVRLRFLASTLITYQYSTPEKRKPRETKQENVLDYSRLLGCNSLLDHSRLLDHSSLFYFTVASTLITHKHSTPKD